MPLRKLLQLLFGPRWVQGAAKELGLRERSIDGKCRRGRLSEHQAALLLARVPRRRREIENEWRKRLAAAEQLAFEWARHGQVSHLDREVRQQLDGLSAAEAWLRRRHPKNRTSKC
jgi:hypothetical protein